MEVHDSVFGLIIELTDISGMLKLDEMQLLLNKITRLSFLKLFSGS